MTVGPGVVTKTVLVVPAMEVVSRRVTVLKTGDVTIRADVTIVDEVMVRKDLDTGIVVVMT